MDPFELSHWLIILIQQHNRVYDNLLANLYIDKNKQTNKQQSDFIKNFTNFLTNDLKS